MFVYETRTSIAEGESQKKGFMTVEQVPFTIPGYNSME